MAKNLLSSRQSSLSAMSETKRIHISGLNTTQCSVQDLHNRFESFQLQVVELHNWPPGKDGVDKVQNWCFLTLKGDAAKIKRATEVLNGTIWKGSKLRIGAARKEKWKISESELKVEEEAEQSDKPKKKKRSKGRESQKVDQPVSAKDVEDGEWGWKQTPAGHLLRPLHLRPSHPLPVPSARPVVESEETEKKEKKRKVKSTKPLVRARRVTVDPSRYGAVHLAGHILDDGTDGLPNGCAWTCQDTENGDVEWTLKDKDGKVVKQEIVRLVKEQKVQEAITDSEDESSMDEVAAAIDNASSVSSSEEEEQKEEEKPPAPLQEVAEKIRTVELPVYDEGGESDFSEGYQEVQGGMDRLPKDWQEEKTSHLELLKNMFGEEGLSVKVQPSLQKESVVDEESEEEDYIEAAPIAVDVPTQALSAGAQKRAALLSAFTSGQEVSKSFKPLVRFDPGVGSTQEEGSDVDMDENITVQEKTQPESETTAPPVIEAPRDDRVQMSSLKDMFKPKEDSKGFTLLGDLDLDLEEEEEDEEMPETAAVPIQQPNTTYHPAHRAAPIRVPSVKLPFVFPSLDGNDKSWLSLLRNDRSVALFCKDKTDEEIQAQWKERKGQLTQDYKRRHREALKKKKRKYTGSRAAGTSMPLRS